MTIIDIKFAKGLAGWLHEDLAALRAGAGGSEVSRIVSVLLILTNEAVAVGDCVDVVFAGTVGRAPPFEPDDHMEVLRGPISSMLRAQPLTDFRPLAKRLDALRVGGHPLHTAVRYGVSQAILHGVALARGTTMAEIISAEYGLLPGRRTVPLLCSCGTGGDALVDRMILKQVPLLPNHYITDVHAQLGLDGTIFEAQIADLSARIRRLGAPDYRPRLRFDFNGSLGELFQGDLSRIAALCLRLERAAAPFDLMLEAPTVGASRVEQIDASKRLRAMIRQQGGRVEIGADEWCNTLDDIRAFADAGACDFVHIKMPDLGSVADVIEAVIHCRNTGMKACLGGSANETDVSARIAAHIALATQPDHMLARPGLGGDEAVMIQYNEMARALALASR